MPHRSEARSGSPEGIVAGYVERDALSLLSRAILESAAAGVATDLLSFWPLPTPPLAVALFEDRVYFDREADRFEAFALSGATVIIGVPGEIEDLPPHVQGVDLTECDELVNAWGLLIVESTFTAALIAVRTEASEQEGNSKAGLYSAKWTFRRPAAAAAAAQILRPLRPLLGAPVLEMVDRTLEDLSGVSVDDPELRLLQVLESVSIRLISAPVLASVRAAQRSRPTVVRDLR